MKSCTNCGALVAPESNICPNCGGMVSNVENNQGVNMAAVPSQTVQTAPEPVNTIPVAPMPSQAPVPAPEPVAPTAMATEPMSAVSVAVAPTPVTDMPIAPAPAEPQPVESAMDPNASQSQSIPDTAPTAPTPQMIENTNNAVVSPTPVIASQPEIQSIQQAEVSVAPAPTIVPEQSVPVVPEPISEVPAAPEPVNTIPVAPMPDQSPIPALEPINTVPVAEASNAAPVALEPGLGSEPVTIPLPSDSSVEIEVKDDKKSKKGKKEPLSSEEKEKKFGRITTIIIFIISIISIAIISFFMYKIVKENEECETGGGTITTQYSYEGFDFFIPKGVVASVEDEEFILRDKENTWSAVITISDGSYNSLVSNKSQISSYFETLEYTSTTAEEKEVSGTSFVTTEVFMGSKNVLIAYAKASGTKIYGVVYQNKLGTYDNYSLNIVGEVLASAIYSGYDSAMPAGFTIDMFEQTFDVAK